MVPATDREDISRLTAGSFSGLIGFERERQREREKTLALAVPACYAINR